MNALRQRIMQTTRPIVRNAAELWRENGGGTAVEYGLICALIVLVIIGALVKVRESLIGLPMQSLIDAIAAVLP